jgi:PPM family protein phosphatase
MRISQAYGGTDTGRRRRHNEDAYVCDPPLFAIADGMGGAQAGEVASGLAAAALTERGNGGGSGERRVSELIQEANRRVHQRASTDAATMGMGTTMTVALVEADGRVVFGHVGDSRAYLLRAGRLEQLTDDHTLVAELVRRGELSPSDAEVHPQRSVITRALGTDPDVDVDTFDLEGRPGDVVLLCSDGLSSMVAAETIEKLLDQHRGDLQTAGKALIHAANRGGGEDNITAVLFELAEGEAAQAPEPDEKTREHILALEDEDTLHPEDHVELPPLADTMVVPAAELHAALDPSEPAPPQAGTSPQAGLARRLLALLVIAILIAVIVVLVWWGLAR